MCLETDRDRAYCRSRGKSHGRGRHRACCHHACILGTGEHGKGRVISDCAKCYSHHKGASCWRVSGLAGAGGRGRLRQGSWSGKATLTGTFEPAASPAKLLLCHHSARVTSSSQAQLHFQSKGLCLKNQGGVWRAGPSLPSPALPKLTPSHWIRFTPSGIFSRLSPARRMHPHERGDEFIS